MRRILVLPLIVSMGLLAGCAQAAQIAGDAVGIPVDEVCTGIDEAYAQYQAILDQGALSAGQVETARDDLVTHLEGLADDIGGQLGEVISDNARTLAESTDLQSPETVEAIEQMKESAATVCG